MNEPRPSSSTLRADYTRDYLLPLAEAWFALEPRCQSVLVTVGQYWCDEAADAVHCNQLACVEAEPRWPESAQAREGALLDAASLAEWQNGAGPDEPVPGLSEVQFPDWKRAAERAFGKPFGAPSALDENTEMIVAFASYCREVSSQEEPSWRSHTPYGLIRRPAPGAAATLEVIGAMHRPEWEDRWDVLEHDGMITEAGVGAPPASPRNQEASSGSSTARVSASPPRSAAAFPESGGRSWPRVLAFLLLMALILAVRACRD